MFCKKELSDTIDELIRRLEGQGAKAPFVIIYGKFISQGKKSIIKEFCEEKGTKSYATPYMNHENLYVIPEYRLEEIIKAEKDIEKRLIN